MHAFKSLLVWIKTYFKKMVTCHSDIVTYDIIQSKTCPQWAFERDLNSSGLVTQNTSEEALFAISRVELIFRESTVVKMEHMEQLFHYSEKWLQDLCDSVILQRKAAHKMFMGLRKLVGHNLKVIKDGMKVLKSVQHGIDQVSCEISNVKRQVTILKNDSRIVLNKVEHESKALLESTQKTAEQKEKTDGFLRQQEETCANTEKALREMKQQYDEASRQCTQKLTEIENLKKDLNDNAKRAEEKLHAERERFKTDRLRYQEETKALNEEVEVEKAKALKAKEQVSQLRAELSLQREQAEARKNENVVAEKKREECLLSLQKAEQEIDYLTKWAHEKSMELQKKDEVVEKLLGENEVLNRKMKSLEEKNAVTVQTGKQNDEIQMNKNQEKCLEQKGEGRSSPHERRLLSSKDTKLENDKNDVEGSWCPGPSIKKDEAVGESQSIRTLPQEASGDGADGAQTRSRVVHELGGSKRRRVSARTSKQTIKASRRRGEEGPSSARTAGIRKSDDSAKNQLSQKRKKDTRGSGSKLQDDDFLVRDDLYSDNVLG